MKGHTSKGLRIMFLVYAIVSVLSGLLHMLSPQTALAQDQAIERVLGGAMLAFALGAGLAYLERAWDRVKIVMLILITWTIMYTITMAWGILSGGLLPAAWSTTIMGAVLSVLFMYLYIREKKRQKMSDSGEE